MCVPHTSQAAAQHGVPHDQRDKYAPDPPLRENAETTLAPHDLLSKSSAGVVVGLPLRGVRVFKLLSELEHFPYNELCPWPPTSK